MIAADAIRRAKEPFTAGAFSAQIARNFSLT
jgi:hypothetical protein